MVLPMPSVPALHPVENWIDLVQLGTSDLETYIDHPDIADSSFWINWRGCDAQGNVVDVFDIEYSVIGDPGPDGVQVLIDNADVQALDQGYVFYSYRIESTTMPGQQGEESLRRFFYVGTRERQGIIPALAVAQFKQSHQLQIILDWIEGDVVVVVPPYRAMFTGDTVTLTLDLYFMGDPFDTLTLPKVLVPEDLGQPLQWAVSKSELEIIEGSFVDVSYSIAYAVPTTPSFSPVQRLEVVTQEPISRLPALIIKNFNDSALNPEAFPDGVRLQVPLYQDIQVWDTVVVYADSVAVSRQTIAPYQGQVIAQQVDISTLDSQVLEFVLGYPWLQANNGRQIQLGYTYARLDAAESGDVLAVMLSKPLHLPTPIVEEATAEDSGEGPPRGYLYADDVTVGVHIRVPDEAELGLDGQVQMHWQGHAGTGSIIVTEPMPSQPRRYFIPPAAIPANMDKRLEVFYQVTTASGEGPFKSRAFDLAIHAPTHGWPAIQLTEPPSLDTLSLADVPSGGAVFILDRWMFMAAGQRVRVRVDGLDRDDNPLRIPLRQGAAEPVTDAEFTAAKLQVTFALSGLQALKLHNDFVVRVDTSFDDGDTYVLFVSAVILLTP
ncbi:hypothetical protein [Pseudomonas ovata]|uniref:hypothetical protein n=1 Tax=Pseudomonas ovata TaxID=1839709 RepID=UPI000D686655|nr:hypothetical protein [Pseudomonas ovata]